MYYSQKDLITTEAGKKGSFFHHPFVVCSMAHMSNKNNKITFWSTKKGLKSRNLDLFPHIGVASADFKDFKPNPKLIFQRGFIEKRV